MKKLLLFLCLAATLSFSLGQVRRDSASRIRFGDTLPATCNPSIGQVFFVIAPGSPVGLHQCLATDTWTPSGTGDVTGSGADNQVAVFTAAMDIEGTTAFTFDSATALLGLVNDSASIQMGASADAQIHRDAADTISQRRGTNEQTWDIYKSFTDASNYERFRIYGGGAPNPIFELEAETAGTGADNIDVNLASVGTTSKILLTRGTDVIEFNSSALTFTPAFTFSISNINNLVAGGTGRFGSNLTTPSVRGLDLDVATLTSAGTRDSHTFTIVGNSFDTFNHEHIWGQRVDVTGDDTNTWILEQSVAGFSSVTPVITITNPDSTDLMVIRPDVEGFSDLSYRLMSGFDSTTTVPTLVPNNSNTATGLGGTGTGLSLITGGIERLNITGGTAQLQGDLIIDDNSSTALLVRHDGAGAFSLIFDNTIGSESLAISGQNGQRTVIRHATTTVAPSGASVTAVGLIPAGSLVLGVTTFVITAVTGPTGYDVGDGNDVDRWGNSIAVAGGSNSIMTDFTNSAVEIFPAANDVVLTSDGVAFTGGSVRVVVNYINLRAPTN